jgi:hypothetical protein
MEFHGFEVAEGRMTALIIAKLAEPMGGVDAPLLVRGWQFEDLKGNSRDLQATVLRTGSGGSHVVLRVDMGMELSKGVLLWELAELPMMGRFVESYRGAEPAGSGTPPPAPEENGLIYVILVLFAFMVLYGLRAHTVIHVRDRRDED